MAGDPAADQGAYAVRDAALQQRADHVRSCNAESQRASVGDTASASNAAAETAALDTLSRLQRLADASPRVAQLRRLQALADGEVARAAGASRLADNATLLPNALSHVQGSDINLAACQGEHLPLKSVHDVQQAQGLTRPSLQATAGRQLKEDSNSMQDTSYQDNDLGTTGSVRSDKHHIAQAGAPSPTPAIIQYKIDGKSSLKELLDNDEKFQDYIKILNSGQIAKLNELLKSNSNHSINDAIAIINSNQSDDKLSGADQESERNGGWEVVGKQQKQNKLARAKRKELRDNERVRCRQYIERYYKELSSWLDMREQDGTKDQFGRGSSNAHKYEEEARKHANNFNFDAAIDSLKKAIDEREADPNYKKNPDNGHKKWINKLKRMIEHLTELKDAEFDWLLLRP